MDNNIRLIYSYTLCFLLLVISVTSFIGIINTISRLSIKEINIEFDNSTKYFHTDASGEELMLQYEKELKKQGTISIATFIICCPLHLYYFNRIKKESFEV